jgi:protein-S-isoprenylcysteine O-methyltransferase Ste14
MLQAILTGQAKSFALLLIAMSVYIYFLPAILAFLKGHRHFFIILVLNIVLSPVQSIVLHALLPQFTVVSPGMSVANALVAMAVNLGPGWLALLAWAFKPGTPNPRLIRAQDTKLYDALAALPLILWFAYGALQLRPIVVNDFAMIVSGSAPLLNWVRCFSLTAAMGFNLLLIYLLVVRGKPVRKSKGLLPRFFAFAGTFLGVGLLQLPVAQLGLAMQLLSAALVGIGSLASVLVLWRLGKSFSIMPEARTLVTSGPYAHARHPLYGVEMISIVGTALQFVQPWAGLIGLGVVVLLVIRTIYEERVLSEAYPEYADYRAKTARFIPGVV